MASMQGRFSRPASAYSTSDGTHHPRRGRSPRPIVRRQSASHQIAILGDKAVGKSAMVVQLLSHRFIYEYDSSADFLYTAELMAGDHASHLNILDAATKRSVDVDSMEDKIAGIGGFVIVYSVIDHSSFQQAKRIKLLLDKWLSSRNLTDQIPVVLVGNKADLKAQRVVPTGDGCKAAEDLNFHNFYEVSATCGQEVEQVFVDLLQSMRAARRGEELPKKDIQLSRFSTHMDSSVSPSHFGSIPEIRGDDYFVAGDSRESDTNAIKRLITTLRTLSFTSPSISPSTSPRSSPRSSPRTSPRTLSPRSSTAAGSPTPRAGVSPRMSRRKALAISYPPMLSNCV